MNKELFYYILNRVDSCEDAEVGRYICRLFAGPTLCFHDALPLE